jgi:PAS domain S-box-containing protein
MVVLSSEPETDYADRLGNVKHYGWVLRESDEAVLLNTVSLALQLFEAQQRVERENDMLRRISEDAEELVVVYNADGTVCHINEAAGLILGGLPDDFEGRSVEEFFSTASANRGTAAIRHVVDHAESIEEETHVTINGEGRWLSVRFYPVRDELGRVSSVLQLGTDITERKLIEEELRRSEERYRRLAEHSRDAVIVLDKQFVPVYSSPAATELFGYTAAEVAESGLFSPVHPDDAEPLRQQIEEDIQHGRPEGDHEFRVHTKEGVEKWVESRAKYCYGPNGELWETIADIRDITDRKALEAELAEQKRLFDVIAENSVDVISVHGPDFEPIYISPSGGRSQGYPLDSFSKVSVFATLPEEEQRRILQALMEDSKEGRTCASYTARMYDTAGKERWGQVNIRYLYSKDGTLDRLVVNTRDVTHQKRAELRLQAEKERVQRLYERESLLRREVHHRIKNDMNFVKSLLSLQANETNNAATRDSLREAAHRVTVVAQVYERLFQDSDFTQVAVSPLVSDLVTNLRASTIPGSARITLSCDEFRLPTRESVSFGIILNELVTNATKYALGRQAGESLEISVAAVSDSAVSLWVRDDGPGFPERILRGEGYGYGLTIIEAVVEQHHGELKLQNNNGATAEVVLPVENAQHEPSLDS